MKNAIKNIKTNKAPSWDLLDDIVIEEMQKNNN